MFGNILDLVVFGKGGRVPGIYLVGNYVNNSTITENTGFQLKYYVVDEKGNKSEDQVWPTLLSLGDNEITISVTPLVDTFEKVVHIYLADTFTIDTTSGFSFVLPVVESTISGGAWSITTPDSLLPSYEYGVTVSEGPNTISMQYTDANGDVFTSDNTVDVFYSPIVPIIAIDGDDDIRLGITTEERYVSVTYLLGGAVIFDGDVVQWDGDKLLTYGGTEVTVDNVSLARGVSTPVITGITDSYGNEITTEWEYSVIVTKIPKLTYTGLDTIDAETYGTSYTATDGLTIDEGQGDYETTATPAVFNFVAEQYEQYTFNRVYSYQGGTSNDIDVVITYNETAGYETDAVNMWLFDNPYVGDAGSFTLDSGKYATSSDIIGSDGNFFNGTTAEYPLQAQSSYLKNGLTFVTDGSQQMRLIKTYTGNEGWFQAEHCFVFNFIGPTLYGSDFEYAVLMNDFNTRVLQLRPEAGDTYSCGLKSSSDKVGVPYAPEGEPQTCFVGVDSSGNIRIETSTGGSFVKAGFAGYPASDMVIGFKFSSLTKQCNLILHEITVLPFWPDADYRTAVIDRSVKRWFEIPTMGESVFSSEGLPAYSSEGLVKAIVV